MGSYYGFSQPSRLPELSAVTITVVVPSVVVGITSTVIDVSDADDTHSRVAEPSVGAFWARHHGIPLRFPRMGDRDNIFAVTSLVAARLFKSGRTLQERRRSGGR